MRFEATKIAGVTVVRWDFALDERGGFARTFCEIEFEKAGTPFRIVQANRSRNPAALTLRGLHFQRAPHGEPKIVSCTRGRIWDVAVDVREGSPTYRQWEAIELSPQAGCALHLAEGIAHGFLTLEPDSDVDYWMGALCVSGAAAGLRWDDPALAIQWPGRPAILSERDAHFPLLDPLHRPKAPQ